MEKYYEFKASSSELAIKNGLAELGLTEDEVEIEVVKQGGIFAKAVVHITPKTIEEEIVEEKVEIVEETTFETEEGEEKEEKAEKKETDEEREERFRIMKEMRAAGKEFLFGLAEKMGADITIDGKVREDEVCFYIGGADAKTFIGYKGETLEAVQTVVGQYLNKDKEERVRVIVDADFYRERRRKTLTALAKKLAQQAYNQHREISLEPMNSYERRIIHAALSGSTEATTRSDGEGKGRHVVIVPLNGTMSYGNASSTFRKKGPTKTKSFGYNKRRF